MHPDTLSSLPFVERFISSPLLASTSDTARSLADLPASGIFVIQADRQSNGRGRSGAAFYSGTDGGIWASIVTPVASIDRHFIHNRALSLAICEAVETACGLRGVCMIKWPNDIYWRDRKLCGILLENHPGNTNMLILGFGCNVSIGHDEFPPELRGIATSLLIETGNRYACPPILKNIVERYVEVRAIDPTLAHRSYEERLYGLDRTVEADGHRGVFAGVEPDGRLRLAKGRELIYIMTGHLRFIFNGAQEQ